MLKATLTSKSVHFHFLAKQIVVVGLSPYISFFGISGYCEVFQQHSSIIFTYIRRNKFKRGRKRSHWRRRNHVTSPMSIMTTLHILLCLLQFTILMQNRVSFHMIQMTNSHSSLGIVKQVISFMTLEWWDAEGSIQVDPGCQLECRQFAWFAFFTLEIGEMGPRWRQWLIYIIAKVATISLIFIPIQWHPSSNKR